MTPELAENPLGTPTAFPQPAEDVGINQGQVGLVMWDPEVFHVGTRSCGSTRSSEVQSGQHWWYLQKKEVAFKNIDGQYDEERKSILKSMD